MVKSGVSWARCAKGERAALMSALILFKLFECAGDAIRPFFFYHDSHVPKEGVVKDVASILMKRVFCVGGHGY